MHSYRLRSIRFACATTIALLVTLPCGVGLAQTQDKTPTEVFTAYRGALAKASSYGDVLPFMEAKGRTMIESIPEAQRSGMFDLLKKFAGTYTDVAVTSEKITGETAVLALSGKDPKGQPATGSVPMTKEATGWKVGTEKWSSKPVIK